MSGFVSGLSYRLVLPKLYAWFGLGELCLILGDGVDQAADFTSCTTSIPSLNFTPLMTFGN